MDRLLADLFQWFMVRDYGELSSEEIMVESLDAMHNGEAFSFNVTVVRLCLRQSFACKSHGFPVLDQGCTQTFH